MKGNPARNVAWRSRITATCALATLSSVIAWRRSSALCKSKSCEELGIFKVNRHAPPCAQLRAGSGHPAVAAISFEHEKLDHPLFAGDDDNWDFRKCPVIT